MPTIKSVMDYSGLDYYKVLSLPVDLFLLMKKNAFLDKMNTTEEGKKYLQDCKRLSTTEPDYDRLRSMPGYQAEEV